MIFLKGCEEGYEWCWRDRVCVEKTEEWDEKFHLEDGK